MNRASFLTTLALTLIGSAVQAAQKPQPQAPSAPAVLESATPGTVAFDDDGGRAQIIPRKAVAGPAATFHGRPVTSRGTLAAVSLGCSRHDRANREKAYEPLSALR